MTKRYFKWFFGGVVLVALIIYSVVNNGKRDNELKNSVVVIATIKNIEYTRASFNVTVEYNYNGRIITNVFGTYNIDSLKVNEKVKLIVSKKSPDKYIKYIGLVE